jgi:hypothetical protein
MTGSQMEVGSSANTFTAKVFDVNGEDVTVQYKITRTYGRLKVLLRQLQIESGSATKVYDRENPLPLTCNTYQIIGDGVAENHILYVEYTCEQKRIGKSENKFTVKIVDMNGRDVSKNYAIEYIYGLLTVTAPTA